MTRWSGSARAGQPAAARYAGAQRLVQSFRDFDEFVARGLHLDNLHRQLHFAPQTDFLVDSLGQLAVDLIGRQENMAHDFHRLCQWPGVQADLPRANVSCERQAAPVRQFCTARTRRLVRRAYQRDYEMLGYAQS